MLASAVLLAGCDAASRARGSRAGVRDANEVLTWVRTVELEETPQVINVLPIATPDWRGGFLVVDPREAQVRRYADDGHLLWHAGRKGSGPGEFRAPVAVQRIGTGEILVFERGEQFTVFDSAGSKVVATRRIPIAHVEDVELVNDSLLLVTGLLRGDARGPRIHVVDARTGTVVRSFFAPFSHSPNKVAAMVADWTEVSVRGDTVAAIFATSDTLYLFTLSGRPLGQIAIPFANFRPVPRDPPGGTVTDPSQRAKFLGAFDYVSAVHWLPDGDLLVPYESILPEQALERRYHLLLMRRSGARVFEVPDVPRLLTIQPRSADLVFVAPRSEVPNRWAIARLR